MHRRIVGGFILSLWVSGSLASCGGESFTGDAGESGDAGTAGTGATGGRSTGGNSTGGNSRGGSGTGGSAEGGGGNVGGSAGTGVPMGGSSGTSNGGSGATMGGASGATTGGAGMTGGMAGTGGDPSVCSLPVEPGTCSGAMTRFAFNPVTGVCHPFPYTGCNGNANNFETIEACYAACGGQGALDAAACRYPIDCKLVPSHCCGNCGQATLENTVAVNAAQATAFSESMSCHLVDCLPCVPSENPWLGATCRAGRCVAFDARETELTDCESPNDCRFRAGLACCENCNASRQQFIALNVAADVHAWVCGDAMIACPGCVPIVPPNLGTVCSNGTCGVVDAELPQ